MFNVEHVKELINCSHYTKEVAQMENGENMILLLDDEALVTIENSGE